MNVISDIGLQQILLQNFQRTQEAAQTNQIKLASGNEFQTYGEYGADALRLISAEGVLTRATAYESAGQIALTRLETQETGLTTVVEGIAEAREGFVRTMATGNAELLLPELEAIAQRILSALNTQLGGVYVFGGADGTVPPVNAQTLSDLAAAPSIAGLFNEGSRITLAVEEGVSIDGGPRASDVAQDILTELQDLSNAPATLGPFQGNLTAAQQTYISSKVAIFDQLAADIYEELGLNGIAQGQASDAVLRNQQQRDLAEVVAAEIEDIDIAEVVARLNQDQIAIEASGRALAQASQLSLLNFI